MGEKPVNQHDRTKRERPAPSIGRGEENGSRATPGRRGGRGVIQSPKRHVAGHGELLVRHAWRRKMPASRETGTETPERKQAEPIREGGHQAEPERTKPPRVAAEHGAPSRERANRRRPRPKARDREGHEKPTRKRSATAQIRIRSPRGQGRKAPRGGAVTQTRLPMYATPARDTKGEWRTDGRIEAPGSRFDPSEKRPRGGEKRHAESAGSPERAKPRSAYCKS